VILLDCNLLLHAIQQSSPRHIKAKAHLQALFSENQTLPFTWKASLAFLRISTKRELFVRPLTANEALATIGNWLDQPNCVFLEPGTNHFKVLSNLVSATGVAGNLTYDAHLAAIAIEHNAELHSFDNNFARFPKLSFQLLK